MRTVGGFFALEQTTGGVAYHDARSSLASGRACLGRILETLKPAKALVPFYICNTVLLVFEKAQIPIDFYDLDINLQPQLPCTSTAGDVILYVNYFGLKTPDIAETMVSRREYLIVDDTQAFFERGHAGAWSFNSARKWFGVPDGAYAYGAGLQIQEAPTGTSPTLCHLLEADRKVAYEKYVRFEAEVSDQFFAMSPFSAKLLECVDYDYVQRTRLSNFLFLHKRLGSFNCLPAKLIERVHSAHTPPFCYPLLVDCNVPWKQFWDIGVFVPRLWEEVAQRTEADAYPHSIRLAERLLAMPIDHRYVETDMDWLVDSVRGIMGW